MENTKSRQSSAAAKDYCSGHLSLRAVAKRHAVDVSSLRQWLAGRIQPVVVATPDC